MKSPAGNYLKQIRMAKGLSLAQAVPLFADMERSKLSRIENGHHSVTSALQWSFIQAYGLNVPQRLQLQELAATKSDV